MQSYPSVEKRIWWFTVSNAADRSRRMSTDEREGLLASRRDYDTVSRSVPL